LASWKIGKLNITGGLSSQYSKQSNSNLYYSSRNNGGLALNAGINLNQKIYKQFYFVSNLRSVNFLLGAESQKNAIWFENGFGFRFGKKKSKE